jgi:uncharacterized protein YggU (UPF0235/DUF167 family)
MNAGWVRALPDGIEVAVRVTPRARRPGIGGVRSGASGEAWLEVAVSEAADRGRATAAVLDLLSRYLNVPPSRASLRAGAHSRFKRVHIAGPASLMMDRLLAGAAGASE